MVDILVRTENCCREWLLNLIADWNSSLMSIVNGKTENHLDMLDNMVIERLLNDKWSTFARVNRLILRGIYLLCLFLFALSG